MSDLSQAGEDRILTLPNAFTTLRLACVPAFVYMVLFHDPALRYQAAALLAALGCTDWVDGYLARRLHQVSSVGKILDPVADRLMLIAGVGALLIDRSVPPWVAIVALGREGLVAVGTVLLAALGARRIDVTWFGKAGTFGLMVAFPLFLVSHSTANWRGPAGTLAWIAALPGLALGLYALILYVPLGRKALIAGRADRAGIDQAAAREPDPITRSIP